MAEGSPAAAPAKPSGPWFARKIGPLPVWAYGALAVGAYYWYTHYGPGASKQTGQQQPAGGGLKTYAPKITETIYQYGPGRRPPPRRRPKPPSPQPATAAATAAPAAATATGRDINPGGPDKRPGRRRKPPPRPEPPPGRVPPGPEQVASASYSGAPATGGPVNADTGQPVYWEWQHAHRGPEVPMPVAAYAPQTNGAVYDAASAGATLAAG